MRIAPVTKVVKYHYNFTMAHGVPDEPIGKVEEKRPKAPVGSRRIFPPQFKLQVSVDDILHFNFVVISLQLLHYCLRIDACNFYGFYAVVIAAIIRVLCQDE